MSYLPKIVRLVIVSVAIILIIALSATFILQDTITGILLKTINSSITTNIKADKVKLSFIRNFPRGSVELKNVLISSSSEFGKEEFEGHFADTLLFAESMILEFRISDIATGNYRVESIRVKTGRANLLKDRSGNANYKIRSKNVTSDSESFNIDLDKILLSEIETSYIDLKNNLRSTGIINSAKLKSKITGEKVELTAKAALEVSNLNISGTIFKYLGKTNIDLNMLGSDQGINFAESTIEFGVVQFGIKGTLNRENVPDLSITANRIGLSDIDRFLPTGYTLGFKEFTADGLLGITCLVTGSAPGSGMPHLDIEFRVENGKISKGNSALFKNINFLGHFTNGERNNGATSSLKIRDIGIMMGQSEINGSIVVSDFRNMPAEITLSGKVYAKEILEAFNKNVVSDADGFAEVDLKLKTLLRTTDTSMIERILKLEPVGKISLNSLSFSVQKRDLKINSSNGDIWFSDIIQAENLRFDYKGQNIKIDGKFSNLPDWLAGKPVILLAEADVSFDSFLPETFVREDKSPNGKNEISFPQNIQVNVNFSAGKVIYKTFSSSEVKASLTYKPRVMTFNSLTMKSLEGSITGKGFVVKNANRSVISRGDFNFKSIDVNKAFTTFKNFGQDFIVAENLSGKLSGSVSMLLPMDSLFRTNAKTITADGTFNLEEGALINFEPVKQLSDFIELSELENIHFQNLKNDFYIRNNVLFIPSMDVKSSAADLTVNGKHSFDNQYEYHVKVLLSQILSKKRKSIKKPVTEFGAVQDDGLGRTSLLLKVENKGDDVKVGYDLKAVGAEVKEGIRNEKQAIKTILNEEYGWYGDGKEPASKTPEAKKKKFTISWSETDSIP